jgi:hypothetical protein
VSIKRYLHQLLNKRKITLCGIAVEKDNTIIYNYTVSDNIKQYFSLRNEFFIKYDFDITKVPKSILAIPFVVNILPIAWALDAELKITELDKNFYEHIKDIKSGYEIVHPKIKLGGKIKVKEVIDNTYVPTNRVAQSFSGGVDSFNTLVNHINEKPKLVTVIGSDIFFDDKEGIKNLKNSTKEIAKQFRLEYCIIESNFRGFLNEHRLSNLVSLKINDGWWHGFQHGIGLIGHIAPIAYKDGLKNFYFPSTFTKKEYEAKISCASYPIIDESVHIASTNIVHDGFEFTRQQKVKNLCYYVGGKTVKIPLRVCWQSRGGKNCSDCEKCFRTITAIIAECFDPNEFGFNYTKTLAKKIEAIFKKQVLEKNDKVLIPLWRDIIVEANRNKDFINNNYPELEWFLKEKI